MPNSVGRMGEERCIFSWVLYCCGGHNVCTLALPTLDHRRLLPIGSPQNMTTFLWIKVACISALVLWEFGKGVMQGIRSVR